MNTSDLAYLLLLQETVIEAFDLTVYIHNLIVSLQLLFFQSLVPLLHLLKHVRLVILLFLLVLRQYVVHVVLLLYEYILLFLLKLLNTRSLPIDICFSRQEASRPQSEHASTPCSDSNFYCFEISKSCLQPGCRKFSASDFRTNSY